METGRPVTPAVRGDAGSRGPDYDSIYGIYFLSLAEFFVEAGDGVVGLGKGLNVLDNVDIVARYHHVVLGGEFGHEVDGLVDMGAKGCLVVVDGRVNPGRDVPVKLLGERDLGF